MALTIADPKMHRKIFEILSVPANLNLNLNWKGNGRRDKFCFLGTKLKNSRRNIDNPRSRQLWHHRQIQTPPHSHLS
jgi:hypothetical protein